jgi:hypothetical protein
MNTVQRQILQKTKSDSQLRMSRSKDFGNQRSSVSRLLELMKEYKSMKARDKLKRLIRQESQAYSQPRMSLSKDLRSD